MPSTKLFAVLLALTALVLPGDTRAQELTLEKIMSDPDWIGRAPENPFWSEDGRTIYFSQKLEGSAERRLFKLDRSGGAPIELSDEDAGSLSSAPRFVRSEDGRRRLFVRHGDLFLADGEGELRQLTRTRDQESSPTFLDGQRISYQRGGQVFVRELEGGLDWQPIVHASADDPEAERKKKLAQPDYLRDQQTRFFDWIRQTDERRQSANARRLERQRADPTQVEPTIYLGKGNNVRQQRLSPGADALIVVTNTSSPGDGQRTKMPRYVTASGFTEIDDVRVKVGAKQTGDRLWMLRPDRSEPIEVDLAGLPQIADDPLAGLRKAAEERRRAAKEKAAKEGDDAQPPKETSAAASDAPEAKAEAAEKKKSKPRGVRVNRIEWSRGGDQAAVLLVSLDNKDRWIALVDRDGQLTPVHHVRDPAWTNWRYRTVSWLPGQEALYLLSEESGYSQLYRADVAGGKPALSALTRGDFVVDSVTPSRDGRWLYFTANPEHPGHYDVFRVPSSEGPHEPERLTSLGGLTSYVLSPDEKHLLLTHSTSTRPSELFVQEIGSDEARALTRTVSDEFTSVPWVAPESIQVPSSHIDRPIYGRLYRNGDGRDRPAVVFVHGAGYLQNAHLGWSNYFREFMFHSLLVQKGYVVLDLDFRASAGYGRDWRTAIYRQMGTPEVQDLRDGVEWLVENHGVDPERVGVYGGSYGGFLTFMALFRDPDLFAAGAALRPVTDWAHYNHPYTSNILNTPDIDPEAYEKSSPLEFADGLNKPLLIASGMLDDNVHFQDSVRLVQKLIELEKEDWEMAIYPVERHGFVEPSSWLDEYRRIFKLFERHLE